MEKESKEENESKYQKRVEELNKKDKNAPIVLDDGDDFLKGMKTFGTDD
jgi:S-adenosylhomocysteine hydrolase